MVALRILRKKGKEIFLNQTNYHYVNGVTCMGGNVIISMMAFCVIKAFFLLNQKLKCMFGVRLLASHVSKNFRDMLVLKKMHNMTTITRKVS